MKEIELHIDPANENQLQTELLLSILANQVTINKFLFETSARSSDELKEFHKSHKKEYEQVVQNLVDDIYSRYGKIDVSTMTKKEKPSFLLLAFSYLIVIVVTAFQKIKSLFMISQRNEQRKMK